MSWFLGSNNGSRYGNSLSQFRSKNDSLTTRKVQSGKSEASCYSRERKGEYLGFTP